MLLFKVYVDEDGAEQKVLMADMPDKEAADAMQLIEEKLGEEVVDTFDSSRGLEFEVAGEVDYIYRLEMPQVYESMARHMGELEGELDE